jgi:anti-sigma regulatory factor (Ser/Thr protein kinase)
VPQARRHVTGTLARWGLGDVADDAQLVTSELVTNAIAASAALPFRADVGLLVAACPGQLILLVWDASQDRPVRRGDDDDAVAGRGLGIVAALTSRWGWAPDGRGKVVWAVLDLEGR